MSSPRSDINTLDIDTVLKEIKKQSRDFTSKSGGQANIVKDIVQAYASQLTRIARNDQVEGAKSAVTKSDLNSNDTALFHHILREVASKKNVSEDARANYNDINKIIVAKGIDAQFGINQAEKANQEFKSTNEKSMESTAPRMTRN